MYAPRLLVASPEKQQILICLFFEDPRNVNKIKDFDHFGIDS